MALVFNNVTVPQSGNVIYNGTSLSVVKHGNTQVWKRAPEYLYNNGDQCSGFTGGWDARAAYFLNTDTYYRNQTGTKPVFNTGNISVTCTGSYLGGGSVIDTAKAIAYGLAEPEKDVWELYEHTRTARKCLPVASILTIAAAGSETSNSSVITRVDTHQKRAYNDDISRPKFALMDPELTKTLPDYQTESGCADIMMHTMERYFTNGGNMELTDALAEGLLRTVMKNALILHTDPANYEARAEVMWAGSLSHNGLTGCGIASGDFMSHKLEHEMGGMFDVTHGAGLAALWPSWARYVYKDCLPRFVRFARNVMGVTTDGTDEEIALKGIDAMVDFYHSIGMPASFHELGIDPTDAQIDEMARRCLEACGSALGSAKKLSLDDMIAIYHAANH